MTNVFNGTVFDQTVFLTGPGTVTHTHTVDAIILQTNSHVHTVDSITFAPTSAAPSGSLAGAPPPIGKRRLIGIF